MAVINLVTLVLRGKPINGNRVAVDMGMGTKQANCVAPTDTSYPSHPSYHHGFPMPHAWLADDLDRGEAMRGAGRSLGEAGVLVSQWPAIPAGWTVQFGWPTTEADPRQPCLPLGISTVGNAIASGIRQHLGLPTRGSTSLGFLAKKPAPDSKPESKRLSQAVEMPRSLTRGDAASLAERRQPRLRALAGR